MDVKLDLDGAVRVRLSKRNVVDLLTQVDRLNVGELHQTCDGVYLQVIVEPDEEHYGDRRPGPGGPFMGPA
mgnify:FL=1